MDVVFQTRFSFYGRSGWQSPASADPALLFDPARLEERFHYFEMITLPGLLHQTDPDFRHMVLSSGLMPKRYRARLRALCHDVLGQERCRVMFRPEGSAGKHLRKEVRKIYGKGLVAQVVLDDDDAVSVDFVEAVRAQGRDLLTDPQNDQSYAFLSFPHGHTLGIEAGRPAWIETRYVPFTNLGLTLVAPAAGKLNPFLTSHRRIGERHPARMVTNMRPYYLRTVHGHNDSNTHTRGEKMTPEEIARSLGYFPWLRDHFADQAATAPRAAQ